ncbi:hypothetical protein [Caulobacter sp. NIBR1757]|uniref:lysozyme inhibitor LprI family protein n=1 Tax=Caulobacter sp. NIBR1757 TaxID=3016000 RepID=UPI0022F13DDA|nr:hypothetical protein [Caulobacter sp. NIBR1757]WGM37899.1 hypothetical protein AMEJIAPC_00800 [Caulobacter sp. NIBR1757]
MRLIPLAVAATVALGGLTVLTLPTRASAASFDCRRAATATERTICANLGLNDRDVRMAQLYDIVRHLVPMGTRGAIMDRQAVWIRERNRCGGNVSCIGQSYDRRIRELNRVLEERVYPQGPF